MSYRQKNTLFCGIKAIQSENYAENQNILWQRDVLITDKYHPIILLAAMINKPKNVAVKPCLPSWDLGNVYNTK